MSDPIYQALERSVQTDCRLIMVAAFSGAHAIATIANSHHRQLAYAAKIAMTTLNIEQRYPDQFPSEGVPALGNAVIRELQAKGLDNGGEPRADIALRLVSSVETQNFAGDVLQAVNHRHIPHLNKPVHEGVHPHTARIAEYARSNPDYCRELEHQAHGYFEKLPPDEAEALHSDIASGREVSDTQKQIIAELIAMNPEDVDKVFRMAQTDLMGVIHAGQVLVDSEHDPKLHDGAVGKNTKALAERIDDYVRQPTGLSAYRLYNQAVDQVEAMTAAGIDVRVRQSFQIAVAQVEITHGAQKAEPSQDNIARLQVAQNQFGR